MPRSLHAEFQKAWRRHDLLICLLLPVIVLLWSGYSAPDGAGSTVNAFSALFYSAPVMNAILMPVGMAVLANRLWDVEIKGSFPSCCTPCRAAAAFLPPKPRWDSGKYS